MSAITCYAIIGASGGVCAVGRCEADGLARLPIAPGCRIIEIEHALFNEIARGYPHYYTLQSGAVVKKKPLTLLASKFTFAANYPTSAPAADAAVVWDYAEITWEAAEPVIIWCNGKVGAHLNSLKVVASTPANIKVQVDPEDPNYYTDRLARAASALGPGSAASAVLLNAEAKQANG